MVCKAIDPRREELVNGKGKGEQQMAQRHSSSPLGDRLFALAVAVALPLLALLWLLRPDASRPLTVAAAPEPAALWVHWIPATRARAVSASPQSVATARTVEEAPEFIAPHSEPAVPLPMPTTAPASSGAESEAAVGLPAESGGSIYDPSKEQRPGIAASDRLRSVAAAAEDSPARVDPLSLAEHPPLLPSQLDPANISGAKLEIVVGVDGIASAVHVVEGSGDFALDAAILEAARNWRYEPARANGEAMASRLELAVTLERALEISSVP